jgi:methionine-rich copper-binding protein CopC
MKNFTFKRFAALAAAGAMGSMSIAGWAHGKLESATPASGSTVDAAPEELRLTFNEDLEPAFSSAKIADSTGAAVTQKKANVEASNPRVMTLAVPKLASGSYTVQWAVMTADAHKTKGAYTFKVK